MDYGPPDCQWGYYAYAPYGCAPYGYYGPQWFYGGMFIGVGPWYGRGWYGRAAMAGAADMAMAGAATVMAGAASMAVRDAATAVELADLLAAAPVAATAVATRICRRWTRL